MARRETIRNIEQLNTYEQKWKIKTNTNKFTVLRLGALQQEELITNNDVHRTQYSGTALGLRITNRGYTQHITNRVNHARHNLSKLYRFYDMPIKIKTHLIKALILPILDYPPIPTHTLSKTQISKLQIIQNKALRYATNQRYPKNSVARWFRQNFRFVAKISGNF